MRIKLHSYKDKIMEFELGYYNQDVRKGVCLLERSSYFINVYLYTLPLRTDVALPFMVHP